jgi:hypothetical protein
VSSMFMFHEILMPFTFQSPFVKLVQEVAGQFVFFVESSLEAVEKKRFFG